MYFNAGVHEPAVRLYEKEVAFCASRAPACHSARQSGYDLGAKEGPLRPSADVNRIFGKQLLLHNKTETRAVASADRNWLLKLIDERVREPISLLHWSFPLVLFRRSSYPCIQPLSDVLDPFCFRQWDGDLGCPFLLTAFRDIFRPRR